MPVLSLAWGNESAARRNEHKLRILAIQKAEEAQELQIVAVRNSEIARTERAAAVGSERKANEEKDRARRPSSFWWRRSASPTRPATAVELKVVDLARRSCARDQPIISRSTSHGSDPLECDRPDLRRARDAGEVVSGAFSGLSPFAVRRSANSIRKRCGRFITWRWHFRMPAGSTRRSVCSSERLARRKARDDADPSELIESLNDLAVAYWESGRPAQAIPLYEAALEKVRVRLGEDHADTLLIIDNLAVAYAAAGEAGRAISLHEAVLQRLRAKLGEEHLTTLVTMNNLARAYEAGLRYAESIALYEKTLPKLRAKLSEDHPTVLTAMCGLARAYHSVGRLHRRSACSKTPWQSAS